MDCRGESVSLQFVRLLTYLYVSLSRLTTAGWKPAPQAFSILCRRTLSQNLETLIGFVRVCDLRGAGLTSRSCRLASFAAADRQNTPTLQVRRERCDSALFDWMIRS